MKVSIITACFNNEKTIKDTLLSVSSQTYSNIEHIIIDGASTDNTLNIIKKYKTAFTKVISGKDKGMYDAINKGLKLATGDIIGLLHSDDELYSNDTITQIAKEFKKDNNTGLLYANGIFVKPEATHKVIRNWISKEFKPWKIYFGWVPLHTTMYLSKEAVEVLGFYDTNYQIASDYEYTLRALTNKRINIKYLNRYVVRMKMGGASTSLNNQYKKSKEDFLIMRGYKLPAIFTLTFKILRKIPQFINK
jgi:glycosyltransferase